MIISDKFNFVFVHIPKTGGTSIKKYYIITIIQIKFLFDGEKVTDINGYRPHISKKQLDKFKGHFKFSFVRNPWSWHSSIWHFFQRPDRNNKIITGISFEKFNNNVNSPLTFNIDWGVHGML